MKNGARPSACILHFAFCILFAAPLAGGAEIADLTPDNALLYVEISRPAELWAALQNTELRQTIRSSFATEFVLSFVSATSDLFCKTLTDRSLGEAFDRYGITAGIISAPPDPVDPTGDPELVMILHASAHAKELQDLLASRVGNTLKARFPQVEVTDAQVGEHQVKRIAFSHKRVWALAFPGNCVAYGNPRAIDWMLTGTKRLGASPRFHAARKRIDLPNGPHVFCYSEATEAAAKQALFYGPGTVMSAVLEIEARENGPSLVRDRIVLSDNVKPPPLGGARECMIGSAFPRGPWLVNQVSFASGADMLDYFSMARTAKAPNNTLDRAFTGMGFLAATAETANWAGIVFAAEVAEDAAAREWLKSTGFKKNGDLWQRARTTAVIRNGYFYLGRTALMEPLIERMAASEMKMIEDESGYGDRLKMLPGKGHAFSAMTAEFLLGPGCAKELQQFKGILKRLAPFVARAENTDKGIEITSVSPCGYGIWLVSLNLSATLE